MVVVIAVSLLLGIVFPRTRMVIAKRVQHGHEVESCPGLVGFRGPVVSPGNVYVVFLPAEKVWQNCRVVEGDPATLMSDCL
jgi:hypothetical protein